jgi:glutamate dehydrogenase
MPVNAEAAKAELIERVVVHARDRLGDQAAAVESFLRQYFDRADPDDMSGRSVVDVYGAAMAHWHTARQRRPGEAKISVYTPDFDQHGWQSSHTVVEIVTDDMPFLVDSVTMELNRHGFGIHMVIHPVVRVRRDGSGQLLAVLDASDVSSGAPPEAFIHAEIGRISEPVLLKELGNDLDRVLGDVRLAVEDWAAMKGRVTETLEELGSGPSPVSDEDVAEAKALLEWMADNHFTFLGSGDYDLLADDGEDVLRWVPESGLGILRNRDGGHVGHEVTTLSAEARRQARARDLLTLTKANARATVHRPSHLDYVGVKRFDASGAPVGERRFLGLYTESAYSGSCFAIPVVRRKVEAVVRRAGFPRASHGEKNLVAVLESYPRDELIQASEDELFNLAMGIMRIEERQQVRLFVRADAYRRFLSCLVYLPKERYTTTSRERMQSILVEAFGGDSVEHSTYLSESVLARMHFLVYTRGGEHPDYDVRQLEIKLAEATRSWADDLLDALIEQCGEEEGVRLHHRYRNAFPAAYRDDFAPRSAVADIRRIETLAGESDLGMHLYHPLEAAEQLLRFKLVHLGPAVSLSATLPLLEHMGVTVVDERPYEVRPSEAGVVWMYDFGLLMDQCDELDLDRFGAAFKEAFEQLWRGTVENDGFNRLVLLAGLTWREITVLRAACKYLRQAGTGFSQPYMEECLAKHRTIAGQLFELFRARFDPNQLESAQADTARLVGAIEAGLEAVESLDEDRILRRFLQLIQAMLRTNYFQYEPDGTPHPYLSFKLAPALVPDLPLPLPAFEVFVYSPRTEAVHLRGSSVARGGIRWSDRREDFRTEVLGLMKAQTVKNAVIVPMGAKGGFVVKRPPAATDRDAILAEVVACYKTFISGMLDLTDNLDAGRVVAPPDVIRYDDDDPYLVVAADKGTATFSDIANALSLQRGFWLGDAFASGGSSGYDHKKMGITARGAWESVKRHFRELGVDVQTTDFSVVGIGDMSGDVFGNGMLLSRHIKLVGAFDHRHIFIDPDPDPEASFIERSRLFGLPRSSWADYDAGLISSGGGVFPRSAKSIRLSHEARRLLAVEAGALTPHELIRAMLAAPVDLLWNGGVGTYVKATTETQADASDRTNDATRVDAAELRCRVVGEGGNLGFTQLARVEFALAGGLINTDAIDNSAGVDCSDHEVNIKILLNSVVADGEMTLKQRDRLLAEMTDEVAALVLRDNYEQTQALGNAKAQSVGMADVHARYIRSLEQAGKLDRELERLPSDEALEARMAAGMGLTTPEFAVLLAYTKIGVYQDLVASDVPEDPYLGQALQQYFPAHLGERFADHLARHPLRREIIATSVANSTVNRAGTSFLFRMAEETGADTADIVRAHRVASDVFGIGQLTAEIEGCEKQTSESTQVAMILEARKLVERGTRWFLRNRRSPLDIEAAVSYFLPGIDTLAQHLTDLVMGADRDQLRQAAAGLVAAEVPADLAARVAGLNYLVSGLDIVEVAQALKAPAVEAVAEVYFHLGDWLALDWLRDRIVALPRNDRWQALARAALRDDLFREHAALAADVLRKGAPGRDRQSAVEAWTDTNRALVERFSAVLSDIKAGADFDLTTGTVALREIRSLIQDRRLAG